MFHKHTLLSNWWIQRSIVLLFPSSSPREYRSPSGDDHDLKRLNFPTRIFPSRLLSWSLGSMSLSFSEIVLWSGRKTKFGPEFWLLWLPRSTWLSWFMEESTPTIWFRFQFGILTALLPNSLHKGYSQISLEVLSSCECGNKRLVYFPWRSKLTCLSSNLHFFETRPPYM